MTTKKYTGYSNLAIPPGESLLEDIECLGISREQLAARCRLPLETIDQVIAGRREITPALAESLAQILGNQASFWLNLERLYQETLAYNNHTRPS